MDYRRLGDSDLTIAPLMFGGNVLGWTLDEPTAFAVLDAFVDAGFNAIDTADVYARWTATGVGTSERMLGAWFRQGGKRDKVVLASKVGLDMGPGLKGLSAPYIIQAFERSLQRMHTDHIDLYQAHADDPDTPQDETLEAFARLIEQGKVRAIGASNYGADRLRSALDISGQAGLPRYETLQPLYNLYDRKSFEDELQPLCVERGLGVLPYFGLASGFLTGKYRSEADLTDGMRGKLVRKYLDPRGMRILAALDAVAAQHGVVPAQVALAWLLAQPGITAPIASATSLTQLDQLMGAVRLTLSAEDLAELDEASAED